MGNQNCLCCQREGPGALNKDETNLSANGKQNQILTPIQVVDQSAFNVLFEKKLPEFGEYSTILSAQIFKAHLLLNFCITAYVSSA